MQSIAIFLIFLFSCSQSPNYYYKRGNSFFINGDYYKALDMYSKAILIKPDFSQALVSRALTYEKIGDKEKAKDDYIKAISADPKYLPAYNNIASILIESGLYSDALYYINRALEIYPKYYYAFYNRGLLNYYAKNYKQSIDDLTSAINLNPKDIAYYYRAMAYYKNREFTNAISDLEKIKDLSSDIVYYQLAKIKLENLDPSAINDINKAIGIKQEPSYYFLKSRIYVKLNNFNMAEESINQAIKLSGASKSSYLYYAGDIYLHSGNQEMARKYYDMAIKVNPGSKDLYYNCLKKMKKTRRNGRK